MAYFIDISNFSTISVRTIVPWRTIAIRLTGAIGHGFFFFVSQMFVQCIASRYLTSRHRVSHKTMLAVDVRAVCHLRINVFRTRNIGMTIRRTGGDILTADNGVNRNSADVIAQLRIGATSRLEGQGLRTQFRRRRQEAFGRQIANNPYIITSDSWVDFFGFANFRYLTSGMANRRFNRTNEVTTSVYILFNRRFTKIVIGRSMKLHVSLQCAQSRDFSVRIVNVYDESGNYTGDHNRHRTLRSADKGGNVRNLGCSVHSKVGGDTLL